MRKGSCKVVTIGGGSSYTPELVEGFIKRYALLPISELWLVDIEEGKEKLEIITNLAKRMVKKAGIPMKIIATLDRKEALKNADFVTTQVRVGLLEARIKDERIALKHGVLGQETNGVGGLFKALRTIPVLLDIVADIEAICPNAWLLNFTNPAGMITEALLRYTNFKQVIGLCNLPLSMRAQIATLMEVEPSRIVLELTGLNHHMFVTNVFMNGVSCREEVIQRYTSTSQTEQVKNVHDSSYSKAFIQAIQALPCVYHTYYFFPKEQLERQLAEYKKGSVRGEVVKEIEKALFEVYKDVHVDEKPKQLEQRGGAFYSEAACNLICSMYNDTKDIQYVNVQNNGTVDNLANESAIEVAAYITKDGPKPIAIGEIPYACNGTIQMMKTFERLTCEAAVLGSRELAIAALNMNPLIPSDKVANDVFYELLEAHKAYLPNFFKKTKDT